MRLGRFLATPQLRVLLGYCVLFIFPVRVQAGVSIGPLDLFAFGMLAWVLSHGAAGMRLLARAPVIYAFLCYALVIMISFSVAADTVTFVKEAVKVVEGASLYAGFGLLLLRRGNDELQSDAMTAWCWTLVIICVIAAGWQLQFVRSVSNPFADPALTERYFRFGWGTIAASNYFAGMLLLVIPALLYRTSMPAPAGTRSHARSALLALAVCGAALLATLSRGAGATLAFGFACSLVMPVAGRSRRMGILAVIVAIAVAAVALSPVGFRVLNLAGQSLDEVANGRSDIWEEAWRQFTTHPILGVGLGNLSIGVNAAAERTYAHNVVLQVGAETGVIGLLTFGALLATLAWTSWVVVRRTRHEPDAWVFVGSLTAILMMVMHNMVESTLVGGVIYGFLFWPLQGLVLARWWEETGALRPPAAAVVPASTLSGVTG